MTVVEMKGSKAKEEGADSAKGNKMREGENHL